MNSLLKLASELELEISYIPLDKLRDGLLGLYVPGINSIFLDVELLKPKNHNLLRCVLCEEIGHAVTGTSVNAFEIYMSYSLKQKITKEEENALIWATEKLIPTNELLLLLQDGFYNCEELAIYFGVTVWFMFKKLKFLQISCKDKEDTIHPIIKMAKISCF